MILIVNDKGGTVLKTQPYVEGMGNFQGEGVRVQFWQEPGCPKWVRAG